jgi:dephospho-CoA kinase
MERDNMITFGLTGGIASGKSTVNKTFQSLGIPMVDADIVARQVVEPGTPGLKEVIDAFGEEYLNEDGTLNRTKLGALIFANKMQRWRIDMIMMPLINNESSKQIESLHDQNQEIVGYDAALICEMGNADKYRPLIVVQCQQDTQVARLMSRNSLTRDEAMSRIEAQMPVSSKVAMADFVINTDGTIEQSVEQAKAVLQSIKKKR